MEANCSLGVQNATTHRLHIYLPPSCERCRACSDRRREQAKLALSGWVTSAFLELAPYFCGLAMGAVGRVKISGTLYLFGR